MNFLAHYVVAMRLRPDASPRPPFIVGNALPDLLPLAAPRLRFRPVTLNNAPVKDTLDEALMLGVQMHLATDTVFHQTPAFLQTQTEIGALVQNTDFVGIRVRRFFIAHILTELALDAVLLRANLSLGKWFYADFTTNFRLVTRWTETVFGQPIPSLSIVLTRFSLSRYLFQYQKDEGIAEGLSRLCERARQDQFTDQNFDRLTKIVADAVALLSERSTKILEETIAGVSGSLSHP